MLGTSAYMYVAKSDDFKYSDDEKNAVMLVVLKSDR